MAESTLPAGQAMQIHALIAPTEHGIASRVLAKRGGGNITLFAFDAGQGLTEHTSPFEAFSIVLDGTFSLTVGGIAVEASTGTIGAAARQHPACRGGVDAFAHVAHHAAGRL